MVTWFGQFTVNNGEMVRVYATRWDSMVRIVTEKEIYLLSPEKPKSFYDELKHLL